jgi:hypothetical protein
MILPLTLTLTLIFQQPIDGTALIFRMDKDSITVQVGRWKLRSRDTTQLSRFVDVHLREIDPAKVLVYGPGSAEYKSFAPIITVLKKHDWLKFKLVDTEAKPKVDSPKIQSRRT